MEKKIFEKDITITNQYEISLKGVGIDKFLEGINTGIYEVIRGHKGCPECNSMLQGSGGYILIAVTDLSHKNFYGYNQMGIASIVRESETGELCAYLHDWSGYDEYIATPILKDTKGKWVSTFKEIITDFIS